MLVEYHCLPFTLPASAEHHRAACPVVALHSALEEHLQVEAFPLCLKIETEVETRSRVADHGVVAMVVLGPAAARDHAVAVEILIHDVACAPSCAELVLAGARTRGSLAVLGCIGSVESVEVSVHLVLSLGDADGCQTPYVTELGAVVIAAEAVVFIGILVDGSGVVIEVEGDAVVEVLDTVAPRDRKLPALGGHREVVDLWHVSAEYSGKHFARAYHVDGLALVVVERTGQTVVEEAPVETDVPCAVLLPGQGRGYQARHRCDGVLA